MAAAVGHGGARGGGGALTGRGGVGGELGGDVGVARAAAGHQRGEQLPAQVGVDGQALERRLTVQQVPDGVQLLGGRGPAGEGLHQLQLRVGAGLGRTGEREQPVGRRDLGGGPVLGRHVQVERGGQLAQQDEHDGGVRLVRDVVQDQVDEVAGGRLAVAGGVPGGGPHERAGQRVVELAEVLDRGGQRLLVEADLGVGEVVVVDQHERGALHADQLRGPRCAGRRRRARRGPSGRAGRSSRRGRSRRSRGGAGAARGARRAPPAGPRTT